VDPALDPELARLGPDVKSIIYNTDDKFTFGFRFIAARSIYRHPDYKTMPRNGSIFGAANDIALIEVCRGREGEGPWEAARGFLKFKKKTILKIWATL
jgi:hypothetical protein